MKSSFQKVLAIAAIACLGAMSSPAQTGSPQSTSTRNAAAGRLDEKMTGANVRVSQLMGFNLQNSQGESVGEIKDIVLDAKSGKVNYAVVTYGGFLGVGNKLFAVPFEAFQVRVDPDELEDRDDDIDEDDYIIVLDVTQQQLEGQQGFDEDNWPNMANKQWAADLDRRYNVDRSENAKDRLMRQNRNINQ